MSTPRPGRTLLFTPGPTNVHPSVRQALMVRDTSHRETSFAELLEGLQHQMVALLGGTSTDACVPFMASGTGANEAILASLPDDLLVLDHGRYSRRLAEIAQRYGIRSQVLRTPPKEPIDPDQVESVLHANRRIRNIYVVHLETTTGLMAPLPELGEVAERSGCRLLVDGISSIGGHGFHLERHRVALCSLNANKCLEGIPGVSFVVGNKDLIASTAGRSRSFYFDLFRQWQKCSEDRETRFTAAVQLMCAADAAVRRLAEETVAGRIRRYRALRDQLRAGLVELGLELAELPPENESNILSLFRLPTALDYSTLRDALGARGAVIHTHREVVEEGFVAIATLGHLGAEDVAWFLDQLAETCLAGRAR